MTKIRFLGEDDSGNSIVYESWQELAATAPWATIDPESLSTRQRLRLINELEPYAQLEVVKNGDEHLEMFPDHLSDENNNLTRFASNNLPRLSPEASPLKLAEQEALAFLHGILGHFDRLHGTCITPCPKRNGRWKIAFPNKEKPTQYERLVDLYHLNLVPRLSPVWHAVRLLVLADEARLATKTQDADAILAIGIAIGESRKALATKQTKAVSSANGGRQKRPDIAQRNQKFRNIAEEIRARNPSLSDSAIAQRIQRKLDSDLSQRTIRNAIKVGK
ncbi:MAG: hypothetical protein FH759_07555 [Sediminimonas qiaohouensis]|uniref:Uncharacterized protein n=1 Tax=Sediminimonas qiaohouensis TaxID=552061 RepID=A0A7C9HAR8_9RHOB|nr:hypothetical protein [Sediminimonas qiaohouensis]MTJ04531.1 hypothetical protein [Sediminimonas qiaohouensis]